LSDEVGATMVEYGITLALIAISVIAAATAIGYSMAGRMGGVEKEVRASPSFETYFEAEAAKAKRKRESDAE